MNWSSLVLFPGGDGCPCKWRSCSACFFFKIYLVNKKSSHKKVLLHKHKRHMHHLPHSKCSLCWCGVHPIQFWTGGQPHSADGGGGYPHPDLRCGTPSPQSAEWGTSHSIPGVGYPPVQTWNGVYPPLVWTDWKLPSLMLQMQAVIIITTAYTLENSIGSTPKMINQSQHGVHHHPFSIKRQVVPSFSCICHNFWFRSKCPQKQTRRLCK